MILKQYIVIVVIFIPNKNPLSSDTYDKINRLMT